MTILNLGDLVEARTSLFETMEIRSRYAPAGVAFRVPAEGQIAGWMGWRTQEERRTTALVISSSHGGLNIMSGVHDQHVTLMELETPEFRTVTVNPIAARVRLLNRFADCLDVSGSL